jgi:DNA-binding NtrC family response regulator
MSRILIVDDDRETCRFIAELLEHDDRQFVLAHEADDALRLARSEPFDLVISDINLNADLSGLHVLKAFKQANPSGQVLLISGFGTLETAIDAARAGAFDYISKPFNIGQMKAMVERALGEPDVKSEPPPPSRVDGPSGLLGRSAAMVDVYNQIARAAASEVPVLIVGESGTGKELVARAIHQNSRRTSRPFVAVNCGAIAESLLESELFGHVRGAFTGAVGDAKGLFEQAHGGTIFLDEIGETSPSLQVKLLRAIEEGEIRPVGSSRTIRVDNRVLAATNADLERSVADQRFRKDLFYRLSVLVIRVAPLRDRRDDIKLLSQKFLERACSRAQRQVELSDDALEALVTYDWPGNVRQLENVIERLVLFSRGSSIEAEDLPSPIGGSKRQSVPEALFEDLPTLQELERRYARHVLDVVGGNRTRAAQVLGIDRRTLYRMAEGFGLGPKDENEPTR